MDGVDGLSLLPVVGLRPSCALVVAAFNDAATVAPRYIVLRLRSISASAARAVAPLGSMLPAVMPHYLHGPRNIAARAV